MLALEKERECSEINDSAKNARRALLRTQNEQMRKIRQALNLAKSSTAPLTQGNKKLTRERNNIHKSHENTSSMLDRTKESIKAYRAQSK